MEINICFSDSAFGKLDGRGTQKVTLIVNFKIDEIKRIFMDKCAVCAMICPVEQKRGGNSP